MSWLPLEISIRLLDNRTTLNIPISKGGANSSHMHNPAKSQSCRGLEFLLRETKFMNACSSTIDLKEISACL